jgi:deoxyhypusine synthase
VAGSKREGGSGRATRGRAVAARNGGTTARPKTSAEPSSRNGDEERSPRLKTVTAPAKPVALDVRNVRRYHIASRESLVGAAAVGRPLRRGLSLSKFLEGLPDILAVRELRAATHAIATARRAGRGVILGMGAHPIKVGLSPLIVDLMERGVITAVALNGACIVHDFELAYAGATSEDVGPGLRDGSFGMAEETGRFLNTAIREAAANGEGLGAGLGSALSIGRLRNRRISILAAGARLDVPVTVHVALGTDIIHMHPEADGAAIGATTMRDFHRLASVVATLDRGVFVNLGSAVVIPEVFVKALNLARNLGNKVGALTTIDMDFNRHYRPMMNILRRPTEGDGRAIQFTGHHELMFPLLFGAVLEELGD